MKITDKIKSNSNIVPFALIFSKSVSYPYNTKSGRKIEVPGPAVTEAKTKA